MNVSLNTRQAYSEIDEFLGLLSEEKRNEIIVKMAELGVATNVHYKPLPMMTAYGSNCLAYPNAYGYYRNLISLPLHTNLTDEEVDYIVCKMKEAYVEVK